MSFIHLISLPSSFSISPRSFSSLNLISLHPFHVCSIVSLSSLHILQLLSLSSIQYLVSVSSLPHLYLAIIFFSCILSPRVLFCHIPLILPVVPGFFYSFPCFLLVCVFVPFTQLNIPPSSFYAQSFYFFTDIPAPLLVFLSLLLFSVLVFFSPAFH
jgi:hypothetical protein